LAVVLPVLADVGGIKEVVNEPIWVP